MEYYSAIIKKWNNAVCSHMNGTRDYHTKWRKSKKERQIPYDINYTWNLKYDTNESIYETDQETQRTDVQLPRRRQGWGRNGVAAGVQTRIAKRQGSTG